MAQGPQTKSTEGRSAGEVIALVLSIGWMILVGTFFYFLPPTSTVADRFDSLRFILILIAIFMPVAMIWVATAASQSARIKSGFGSGCDISSALVPSASVG